MANPSGPLTGWAFKQPGDSFLHWAGPLSDMDGKTQATYNDWAFAQSRDWEPLWRENIISIVRLWLSL